MRAGEIWQLAAYRLHSATNFSEVRRLNLCLDFELGNRCASSLLRANSGSQDLPDPQIIMRQPMDEAFRRSSRYHMDRMVDRFCPPGSTFLP